MQIKDVFWCAVWLNKLAKLPSFTRRIPAKRCGIALHAPARLISVGGYIHADRDVREGEAQSIVPSARQKRPTLALRRQDRFHPKGFNMWKLTTAPATEWEGGFSVPGILHMSVREYMASRVSAAGRGHRTRSMATLQTPVARRGHGICGNT